jgi:hypothetical protein
LPPANSPPRRPRTSTCTSANAARFETFQ